MPVTILSTLNSTDDDIVDAQLQLMNRFLDFVDKHLPDLKYDRSVFGDFGKRGTSSFRRSNNLTCNLAAMEVVNNRNCYGYENWIVDGEFMYRLDMLAYMLGMLAKVQKKGREVKDISFTAWHRKIEIDLDLKNGSYFVARAIYDEQKKTVSETVYMYSKDAHAEITVDVGPDMVNKTKDWLIDSIAAQNTRMLKRIASMEKTINNNNDILKTL
jgi:hypothetical protein